MTSEVCGRDAEGEILAGYLAKVGEPVVRFRFGYKVIGCDPRLLGTVGEEESAESRAKQAAGDVSKQMAILGGPTEVEWWTQQVTITADAVYEQPCGDMITDADQAVPPFDPTDQ